MLTVLPFIIYVAFTLTGFSFEACFLPNTFQTTCLYCFDCLPMFSVKQIYTLQLFYAHFPSLKFNSISVTTKRQPQANKEIFFFPASSPPRGTNRLINLVHLKSAHNEAFSTCSSLVCKQNYHNSNRDLEKQYDKSLVLHLFGLVHLECADSAHICIHVYLQDLWWALRPFWATEFARSLLTPSFFAPHFFSFASTKLPLNVTERRRVTGSLYCFTFHPLLQ